MLNVHSWKLRDPSKKILAQVLTCEPLKTGGKATHIALNGAVYIQTIGTGADRLKLTIYCDTLADKYEIDVKNDEGYMFNVTYRDITYYGYINEPLINWSAVVPGSIYTGTCTFIVDHFKEAKEVETLEKNTTRDH